MAVLGFNPTYKSGPALVYDWKTGMLGRRYHHMECPAMTNIKILAALACVLVSCQVMAVDCSSLEKQANEQGIRIPESNAVMVTIGTGRVQFYGAPNEGCMMKNVFVLPKEELTAYSTYGDFTSVMYMNPKTGEDTEGWVKSSRVKYTGYGIGPN